MGRTRKKAENGDPPWLATYADAMTLLLCFFVLLITFSSIDKHELRGTMLPFRGALGLVSDTMHGEGSRQPDRWRYLSQEIPATSTTESPPEPETAKEVAALAKLKEQAAELEFAHRAQVALQDDGVLVRIDERIAFGEGSSALSGQTRRALDLVADFFLKNKGEILVEAFGDGPEARPADFARSPVGLSVERALAAADYVATVGEIPIERFSISGYGNDLPAGSMARGLQFLLVNPGKTTRTFSSAVVGGWKR